MLYFYLQKIFQSDIMVYLINEVSALHFVYFLAKSINVLIGKISKMNAPRSEKFNQECGLTAPNELEQLIARQFFAFEIISNWFIDLQRPGILIHP